MFRAVLAAAAAAHVVPDTAQAARALALDRAPARPGPPVPAYQADPDGNPSPAWDRLDGVTLYLARVNQPARRVRLGPMGIDANGVWSIDFRVPKVRPGLYEIFFFCGPCGHTSFGSTYRGSAWTGKPGRVLKVRR